jgi:hypothetical protein
MAMRSIASVFAPNAVTCYAGCEGNFDYQDLIVTKCNHVFCRSCLAQWFLSKDKNIERTCPLDKKVLSLITPENVRNTDNDPRISVDSTEGMQYTSFKLHLERFTYYIQKDLPTLKETLVNEKVMKISSCELLKGKPKPDSQESDEDACPVCITRFPQLYFIIQDEDQTRVGCFMHEDCWQKTVDDKSLILDISVRDMAKVAELLPPPKALPKKPSEPPSPVKVFFVAVILPMSLWALAMNTRIYHNKSFVLFVLSIPALIIFKALSLILNGLKAVFNAKPI